MSTLTDDDLTALLEAEAATYEVPPHGPAEVVQTLGTTSRPSVPLVRRGWAQLTAAAAVTVLTFAGVAAYDSRGTVPTADTIERRAAFDTSSGGKAVGGGTTGGTTGGGDGFTSGQEQGYAPQAAPLMPAPQPAAALDTSGRNSVGAGGAPVGQAPPVAVDTDGAEGRVVKTGTISLVTKDGRVSATLSGVQRAATAQGGYVSASKSDEYGDSPSGEVTIRVPVARFERLVAAIRGLDAEVRTATTSGKDVTAQYADLEAQLRTLKATRERFLTILSRASTISEILSVQQRVDGVTGQIDRLEGSRKLLASQSELSTLTVSVSEESDPVVRVAEERSGLAEALSDAKDGFVTGVEAIVRHSGRAVLWLLCLGVLVLGGRAAWKVARRRLV